MDMGATGQSQVLFVNRFAYPDHSATAQILTQISEFLAEQGHPVKVITSRARYSGGGEDLPTTQTTHGVTLYRTWTSRFGRQSMFGRTVDYLSFYLSSFFSVLKHARSGDIIISKTDPPLLGVTICLAARLKSARHVSWLQDLYPEVAAALDVRLARGPAGHILKALRNLSLGHSERVIAIGARMRELIEQEGIDPPRITVLPNFCRDHEILPDPPGTDALRQAWGFSERDFIVGYSGNLGRAHDHHTLLETAALLQGHEDIRFLFIGGGHAQSLIAEAARERGLDNISFQPYQPEDCLNQSLSVPDLHWLSLKPELEGLIVPSKFYGIAAAGRPAIVIGDPDGEIGSILVQYQCGAVLEPGQSRAFADLVIALKDDPHYRQKLGLNARKYLEAKASRQATFQKWNDLICTLQDEISPRRISK